LTIKDLRDYAVILINGKYVGSLDRRHNQNQIELDINKPNTKLEIVVENVGRVNYGPDIPHNRKGITEMVLWNNKPIKEWISTPLPLYKENPALLKYKKESINDAPVFLKGSFTLDSIGDSFLDMSQWCKGAVWVNGHSLGKFWNIGPQQTLYIPAPWLKKGRNEIVVFAYENNGIHTLRGLDQPILNQIGIDKNKDINKMIRNYNRKPVLDKGDQILTTELKLQNDWQECPFENNVTLRHLCIETLSSYENDNEACILEIDLLDEKGNLIPKDNWQISYVNSEQTNNNIGIAENIIDGDISSFWHTESNQRKHPHILIVDLQQIYKVTAFRIKLREGAFLSGKIKNINLYGRPQFFLFNNQNNL
ncbi:MAG: discoidin domain-containing protein, partial [Bacteroidales bacterium]